MPNASGVLCCAWAQGTAACMPQPKFPLDTFAAISETELVIKPEDRRRLFEDAVELATGEGLTVREALRRLEKEAAAAVAGGSLGSATIGGIAQTYAVSGGDSVITAAEIVRAIGQLIDLWDAVVARWPDKNEQELIPLMLALTRTSIRSLAGDITWLRAL